MGRNKCVQLLLEAGCPLDAADEDGTAIENARMRGHRDCELLLREARDAAAAEAKGKKRAARAIARARRTTRTRRGRADGDDARRRERRERAATARRAEEAEERGAVPLFAALSQLPADELATALESLRLRSAASAEMVEKFEPALLDMLERWQSSARSGPCC